MSSEEIPAEELVQFVRLASTARGLYALVCAEHELRVALRCALVARQWSRVDEVRRALTESPPLAARFGDSLLGVLETPELGVHEAGERWHGLVLAIPVSLASRSGTLVSLPHPLARALREDLQRRFPPGTGMRLINRPVPQLVAHTMGTQSLYELIEELASGERRGADAAGPPPASEFAPSGRSLGRYYFFALALTTAPERLRLELPGALQAEPALVKWAAAQTEKITSDFAERGWPLLMRVHAPQRLREALSSPPVLGDVREMDGVLELVAARHGVPVTALRAELALASGEDAGLRIAIGERHAGAPRTHALYRLAALGAEAGVYRVAVRLASAGVELVASDESLRRAVERAVMLTNAPPPSASAKPHEAAPPHRFRLGALRSRLTRSPGISDPA